MAPNPFQKATKAKSKIRLAVIGPSGAGKTWSSLAIAARLAAHMNGRVAVIDTERGSASLYSDSFDFDVMELPTFTAQHYMDAIHAAESAGYPVIVIDSLSHAWAGPGGVLEFVDNTAKRSQSGNSYTAWRDGTKLQNQLVDAMLGVNAHLIVTMRSKQEYVQEKDGNGRTQIRKVGMQPVQRDGLDYEFTVTADMDTDNNFMIGKTRISSLNGRVIPKPDARFADELIAWMESGAEPAAREVVDPDPKPAARVQSPVSGTGVSTTASNANGVSRGPASERTGSSSTATNGAERGATPPTTADDGRAHFWGIAQGMPQFTVDGKFSKKLVHQALGIALVDGALADWVAAGHSYQQAESALKLGIQIEKQPTEPTAAELELDAELSGSAQPGLGLDVTPERHGDPVDARRN